MTYHARGVTICLKVPLQISLLKYVVFEHIFNSTVVRFLYGNCVNFEIMFKSCLDRNTFVLQADPLVVGSF